MKPKSGKRLSANRAKRSRAFVRARWLFEMLVRTLGAECAECGETELTLLQVDHIDGITWKHNALRYDARVAAYVREYAEGLARLRCLCKSCNSSRNQVQRQPGEDDVGVVKFDYAHERDAIGLPDAPF